MRQASSMWSLRDEEGRVAVDGVLQEALVGVGDGLLSESPTRTGTACARSAWSRP